MKKYNIILADPPWQFSNKKTGGSMKSGAQQQYPVMTIDDLKNLDVNSIASDDCVLFMWWVGAMPQEAIDLVHAWGFTLKNMKGFDWNKLTVNNKPFFGMGFWTRAGSESAIIATKGKPKPLSHSVRAVGNFDSESLDDLFWESVGFTGSYKIGKHSEKPSEYRDKCVELMGDVPRLEMFARKRTKGWDVFGNEVKKSISINAKKTLTIN